MPRTQRMIIDDQSTVYHIMSRTALDGFPLGDVEKDFMADLKIFLYPKRIRFPGRLRVWMGYIR